MMTGKKHRRGQGD